MLSPVKIKVCGMKDVNNILDVGGMNPDYMGFIEYSKSPRYVHDLTVPEKLGAGIVKVGVFVNETPDAIVRKANQYYDLIQLHGAEPVDTVKQLKDQGFGVIKVFSVDDTFDFAQTKPYVPFADYFLFDTKGKLYGGNASVFNWDILRHYDQEVPFFLSGGLSAENLDRLEELEHMNLHAIDLNSGVEILPGMKDIEKIKRVLALINNFNNQLKR